MLVLVLINCPLHKNSRLLFSPLLCISLWKLLYSLIFVQLEQSISFELRQCIGFLIRVDFVKELFQQLEKDISGGGFIFANLFYSFKEYNMLLHFTGEKNVTSGCWHKWVELKERQISSVYSYKSVEIKN